MIHTGKNGKHGTEHWIKQYGSVLEKYPNMRIYGWQKAIKELFESGTCDGINHYELYDDCWPQEENFKNEDDMWDYTDKMAYNFKRVTRKFKINDLVCSLAIFIYRLGIIISL